MLTPSRQSTCFRVACWMMKVICESFSCLWNVCWNVPLLTQASSMLKRFVLWKIGVFWCLCDVLFLSWWFGLFYCNIFHKYLWIFCTIFCGKMFASLNSSLVCASLPAVKYSGNLMHKITVCSSLSKYWMAIHVTHVGTGNSHVWAESCWYGCAWKWNIRSTTTVHQVTKWSWGWGGCRSLF